MIKKRINQVLTLLLDIIVFLRMKFLEKPDIKNKVLYVEFKYPNLYHRYFYNLLKIYQLAGYSIVYPMNFQKFRNLRNGDTYMALLFKEKMVIKNIPYHEKYIRIEDEMFSEDYYKEYFTKKSENGIYVPMSMHPYMYLNKIWNEPIENNIHINSIFSFGNFDREAYKNIKKSPFEIIDRAELIDFFSRFNNYKSPKTREELNNIIESQLNHQFIFAEKYNFRIPMQEIRKIASQFRYFLCCPGVFAPLSHNFTEIVSTGAVPIIQKSYADNIHPALEHYKNAIIFENLTDLKKILGEIFQISELDYQEMRKNVLKYYADFLSPESVTELINKNLGQKIIYLNASKRSTIKIKNYNI